MRFVDTAARSCEANSSVEPPDQPPSRARRCCSCFVTNFLLWALLLALIVGLAFPGPGRAMETVQARDWPVMSTIFVAVMFIVNGLCLNSTEVRKAVRSWRTLLYSAITILGVTPILAWAELRIALAIGVEDSLVAGFVIFNAMPTTLSSGLSLVQQAKGNAALALLITVGTNVVGVFVSPLILSGLLSSGHSLHIDPAPLLAKLCITIIAPLLLGKGLRDCVPRVARSVANGRMYFTLVQQSCVVLIAWMQLSKASAQILGTPASELWMVLLTAVSIHGTYLVFNWGGSRIMRFAESDRKAVIILCSQKTFPVAMAVISFLDPNFVPDNGLLIIPCLCSHFVQLFWDAIIATWWANRAGCATVESLSAELALRQREPGHVRLARPAPPLFVD